MTRILLTPQRLDTESNRLIQAAADMNCINSEIARIVSSLDWQVRSRGNVEGLIERAASDGKTLATEVERLGQYLRIASQTFQEADANAKTRLEETTCMMPISSGMAGGVAVAGGFIAGLVTGGQKFVSTGLSWIKKVIGVDSLDETQTKESKKMSVNFQKSSATNIEEPIEENQANNTEIKNPVNPGWPNSTEYMSPMNPFAKSGFGGQCTAFVWGRVAEKTTNLLPFTGDAKTWWDNANSDGSGYSVGSTPRANAIAVWAGDSTNLHGHVGFVESVTGNNVTFTEANVSTYNNSKFGGGYDGQPETLDLNKFETRGTGVGKILGYIYIN